MRTSLVKVLESKVMQPSCMVVWKAITTCADFTLGMPSESSVEIIANYFQASSTNISFWRSMNGTGG